MADQKITALTSYTPAIDTDVVPIVDITTSTTKKITWANIKATLKTYFDSLYQSIASTASKATTFTFDGSGGTSGSVTLQMQKIGNWVIIFVPPTSATTGTNSQSLISNTVLDAAFRPTQFQYCTIPVLINNGTAATNPGILIINTSGNLIIRRDPAATNFTNSATGGTLDRFTATYYVG